MRSPPAPLALSCLFATLLCVACADSEPTGAAGSRRATRPAPAATPQWLTDVTDDVGLDFVHQAGPTGELRIPEIMGAGAALFDFDGDGDLDVYLTSGNWSLLAGSDRQDPVNRLYRQEPDGTFVDATAESGLGDKGYGMGVAIGDVDNDGDEDVYVTNFGPDRLFRNLGGGRFEDVTAAAGIEVDGWSASAAFLDYDRDGLLDLYVARYVVDDPAIDCFDTAGRRDYCGPTVFAPATDVLLHNDGAGSDGPVTFSEVSEPSGIASVAAAGLGVVCEDFDGDGWQDVYVANDAYPNQLWLNQGDGTFRDEGLVLGVALNMQGRPEAGMGVISADFDDDGLPDIFVTHLRKETNTIYRNLGAGLGFRDISALSGLGRSSMPYTGFGTSALDIELDGDLDIVVANGRVQRHDPVPGAGLPPPWDLFAEPNLVYLSDGAGGFTSIRDPVASFTDPVEITRGLATGDIDGDGDLDLLVSNIQGRARLYRNDTPRAGHWLSIRAVDPRWRRDALGARVTVWLGSGRRFRTISSGSSYLSSSAPRAHFGLGSATGVDRIEILWPDGLREAFSGTAADRQVLIERGTGEPLG